MKTLDEVIKAVHHCGLLTGFDDTYENDGGCPYENCSKCEQKRMLGKDIIQYLTAYKDDKNELTALRAFWAEQQANPALTWSELRQMEGKPVWVEKCQDDEPKGWLLILRTNADVVNCTTKHGNSFYLYRSLYGEKWQAYRKEHK